MSQNHWDQFVENVEKWVKEAIVDGKDNDLMAKNLQIIVINQPAERRKLVENVLFQHTDAIMEAGGSTGPHKEWLALYDLSRLNV
jgi:hypothetical protein